MVRSYFLNDVFWSIDKLFWLWIPHFFLKMLYKFPIPYKRTTLKPSSATRIESNTGRSSRKTRFSLPEMCLNTIKLWRNNLNKRKLVFSNGQARVLESCSRMSWKSQSTESIQLIWWRLNAFALTNEPNLTVQSSQAHRRRLCMSVILKSWAFVNQNVYFESQMCWICPVT